MSRADIPPTWDRFVGRDDEIRAVETWLNRDRLVTVIGPPGAGKTRLSRELARRSRPGFAHIRFADLSDAHGVEDVIDRLAELWDVTVSGQSTQERADALGDAVSERPVELVILDNFETVLDAATTVAGWARHLPHRFLVTSTTALDVRGEHIVRIGALPADDAARLFIERAFVERDREATKVDLASVSRIVERLDGLPLAIELAARQVEVFSTTEIEAELDSALELLASGARDAPARHQSLRAMVEWGWSHLGEHERRILEAAAIFEGGMRREALGAVLDDADIAPALESLQRKSMLVVDHREDHARFVLLNTIAAFARRQLEARPDEHVLFVARHLRWFAGLARAWLDNSSDADNARRFEQERANVVAALRRVSMLTDPAAFDDGLHLALALRQIHERRGVVPETAELIGQLLDAAPPGIDLGLAARARAEYGELLRRAGDPRGEREVADAVEQARRVGDEHALCRALMIHAEILFARGDREDGVSGYRDAVEAALRSRDRRLELDARQSYVVAKHFVGEFELAEHEAVHALAVRVGDPWIEATCLTNIGIYLRDEGRLDEAIPRLLTAIERFRELGDEATAGQVMLFLGVAYLYSEAFDEAETVLQEAREILEHRGPEVRQMAEVALARVAVARGDFARADPLLADIVRRAQRDEAFETEALARIERHFMTCAQRDLARVRRELAHLPDAQRVRSFEVHQHTCALHAVAGDLEATGTPALDALVTELAEEPAVRAFAMLQRAVVAALREDEAQVRVELRLVRDLGVDPNNRFELRRWWRWLGGEERDDRPRLLVEPDCKRIRPPEGDWIDLSRKGRSRAVVRTLLEHRLAAPGAPLSPEELFERAWPDTTIQHDSAMARVYTAISEIRKMGLDDVIERTDLGYLIRADVVVEKL